jgi:hypothetical protein
MRPFSIPRQQACWRVFIFDTGAKNVSMSGMFFAVKKMMPCN